MLAVIFLHISVYEMRQKELHLSLMWHEFILI